MKDISVVVPVFNEAAGLTAFFARLRPVLTRLSGSFEVICVDDGSRDGSWDALTHACHTFPELRAIRLSRNFGKEVAMTAGMRRASGRAVVLIDADLQHPPELIETFVQHWYAGIEMVYAVRQTRDGDSPLRGLASRAFYAAFRRLANVRMPEGAGDFRLLDRRIVDALVAMPERARFMKGLYAWVGFSQLGVPYDPPPRNTGASAFSYHRLIRFAVDALVSFSTLPLVACGYLGLIIAVPSLAFAIFLVVRTFIFGIDVPGYASVIVAVLVLGGIQLLTLGLFGAYLGRVFEEVKQRPLYLERALVGFADPSTIRATDRACHPAAAPDDAAPPAPRLRCDAPSVPDVRPADAAGP
jgi:polyisoprenyl-phosphate glycosyltransferase